jgi:anti-sigma factor (TIGR02949 family)
MSDERRTSARRSQARRDGHAVTRDWVATAAGRLGVTESTIRRWIRTGRLNPSCRDVYGKVFGYLDRELTPEERAEVERHIAGCPGCEEHFAFDGTVLHFIRQRVPRALCPPDVQDRLLAPFRQPPDTG